MLSSAFLYDQAAGTSARAERCRAVADILHARRSALIERHHPVAALHREEIWRGRAALASRMKLRRVIGAGLYSLGTDLASTVRALRSQAETLDWEAFDLRRRAHAQARAEAEATAEDSG